jgi:hypothetical protein
LVKLVTILLEEPFMKWGFDFVGPIKLAGRFIGNNYMLVAIVTHSKLFEGLKCESK